MRTPREDVQGIQSIQVGHALIRALVDARAGLSLGKLAEATGMSTSKARGYLLSYMQLGLVQQLSEGGLYDLGPAALAVGVAALGRVDAVNLAREALPALHAAVGETVCLSVWSQFGPVVFDKIDGPRQSAFALKIGTIAGLLTTATGRVFLAYLPESTTKSALQRENEEDLLGVAARLDATAIAAKVRESGMAIVKDLTLPGFSSLAAPIFDARQSVCVTVNIVGPTRLVDLSFDGSMARELRAFAADITERGGGRGPDEAAHTQPTAKGRKPSR